jgi:hypothetical protein
MGGIIPHKVDDSVGRFGSPEVIHTIQGPSFHNEMVTELIRLCGIDILLPQRIQARRMVS